nr:protein FAR1-RELATED SEQUENCE 5-like [Aegilops tauschii subsp. strangulata]
MDEETSFTADDNGANDFSRTDNDPSNEDDNSSDNDSWSSYDILPSEDVANNEHGAKSENEGSDGPDGGDDEAEIDIEEAQYHQQKLETHWKVMAMTFRSQRDAYTFYNKHAKEHGFSIRREKTDWRLHEGRDTGYARGWNQEKMKLIAKGDVETAVGIMRSRKAKDPDFFFEYKLDKEGRLKSMFWCDAQSRRDYQDYGDVVVFDSTYKMNIYGMPFVPFVGVNNHRCTTVFWRHLHYKSLDEFRSLLYYATSEENFEERWTAFVNKWKTDKTEEWLRRMYRKRRMWAASYLSDGFFHGMRSNQRSESPNSSLHLHLNYGMTIVDLVVHYENYVVHFCGNEANDDCEANQKVPPVVTEYKDIEEHAAKKMGELEIFETLVGIERQTFIVTWLNNHKFRYNVVYEPGA